MLPSSAGMFFLFVLCLFVAIGGKAHALCVKVRGELCFCLLNHCFPHADTPHFSACQPTSSSFPLSYKQSLQKMFSVSFSESPCRHQLNIP